MTYNNCTTGPGSQGRDGGDNLQTAIEHWQTPNARDWKENHASGGTEGMTCVLPALMTGPGAIPTNRILCGLIAVKREGENWAKDPMSNRTKRLGRLGNSVVPQIAEWVGRRILEFEEAK